MMRNPPTADLFGLAGDFLSPLRPHFDINTSISLTSRFVIKSSRCMCVLQARMLMVEENLMKTIIRTFVDHLRHRDLHGRFQFDRYTAQQAFKFGRVQSLIGDLK